VYAGEEDHARPGQVNIKSWIGLSVEESVRMAEDRDKWRKYVHGVANPQTRTAKQQNRTEQAFTTEKVFCDNPHAKNQLRLAIIDQRYNLHKSSQ